MSQTVFGPKSEVRSLKEFVKDDDKLHPRQKKKVKWLKEEPQIVVGKDNKLEVVSEAQLLDEFLKNLSDEPIDITIEQTITQRKADISPTAFLGDVSALDSFLESIQKEEEVIPQPEEKPLIKEVIETIKPPSLTKPKTNKPQLDPNIKAVTDRLNAFERRLSDMALRPMGQDPGGGETRLRFLDDVDRTSIVDGWFLKYNGTTEKFEFASPTAASFNETDIRAVYAEVKNGDTVTIHKGDPVYLYRATGNKASVILAGNTGDSTSAKTLGLAYNTFAPGATGLVITKGTLTGVDTSAYAEGDTLYLGAAAGTLTNVKPYSPNHLVYIGVVERANQGQGQIYVSPQNGYELDEIHNVNINHINALADGDYLKWSASNNQWVNQSFPSLFSGSYNDLTNKPTIPSLTGYATESYVTTAISNVIGAAPDALNTLKEIADQLATDESAVSSLTTAVSGKVSLTGSYSNPDWITSLSYNKLTDVPVTTQIYTLNPSPSPATPFRAGVSTSITSGTYAVNISAITGLSGFAVSKDWYFTYGGEIVFPDESIQTTAWTGTYSYTNLTDKPTLFSGSYNDLTNKPSLFSGSYTDLTNKPTLFSGAGSALTGTSLATSIVSSSLTSVGTLTGLTTSGAVSITYTPGSTTGSAITTTGKDTQGGTGYFDFFKATNTTSGVTNPNKTFRLTSTGTVEIINSAYSATLLSLSDAGYLSVSGDYRVNGKKAVNGPSFRAYVATGQQITSGSQQKVTFGTENFDTDGCFASSTFTPNVEGYYQFNATVRISGGASTGECMLVLYKNGSEYARGNNQSGTEQGASFYSMQVSDIAYANGTTDNFDIRIQQTSGGDRTTTAGSTISYFSGCMIRGA